MYKFTACKYGNSNYSCFIICPEEFNSISRCIITHFHDGGRLFYIFLAPFPFSAVYYVSYSLLFTFTAYYRQSTESLVYSLSILSYWQRALKKIYDPFIRHNFLRLLVEIVYTGTNHLVEHNPCNIAEMFKEECSRRIEKSYTVCVLCTRSPYLIAIWTRMIFLFLLK